MDLKFDATKQHWDDWRRFYNQYRDLVVFDRGEAVLTARDGARPDQRGLYRFAGISVVSTTDPDCPMMTLPDGTPVKPSWFANGPTQTLLVDHDTRRVVRIWLPLRAHGQPAEWQERIPEWLRMRCTVYWPGAGCPPVGAPVLTTQPVALTSEQKSQVADNVAACKAWLGLIRAGDAAEELKMVNDWRAACRRNYQHESNKPVITTELLAPFADIPEVKRVQVVHRGTQVARESVSYPYLLVAPERKL